MKKIKWIGPKRFVPGLGTIEHEDTRNVSEQLARGLIKQGLAEPVEIKKKKAKKEQ